MPQLTLNLDGDSEGRGPITPGLSDVERWRPIGDWLGYEVSDWGRVRSFWGRGGESKGRRGLVLKPKIIGGYTLKSGHIQAALYRPGSLKPKRFTVHSLVLEAFVGPRPRGKWALHNDGNPGNNRVENLRWGTASENQHDALRHGDHGTALLHETEIPGIWSRLVAGESARSIARAYGVKGLTITQIRIGATWSHITRHLPGWPLVDPGRNDREPVFIPGEFAESSDELWRPVVGFPAYRVSTFGRIQTCWEQVAGGRRGEWRMGNNWQDRSIYPVQGYLCFWAGNGAVGKSRMLKVHQVVLEAFACPKPRGMVGCHADGNPLNNHASNLRWDTHKANAIDRERHRA